MKFEFSFVARKIGSIGVVHRIKDDFEGENMLDAKAKIWNKYEHVSELKVKTGGKWLPIPV